MNDAIDPGPRSDEPALERLFERLQAALAEPAAPVMPTDAGSPAPTVPGYDLGGELARGAQGVVFRGVQRSTGRAVAIKLLRPGVLATRSQRLRFERELDALATLRHPGIVTVLDGGHTPEGCRWIAMELVDGPALDEFVRRHAIELGTGGIVRLVQLVCDAIAAAHRRGVIHRDIKPANSLVESIDGAPQPRVLDFGLARQRESVLDDAGAMLTCEGVPMGTLAYASPEQVTGAWEEIDTRTDVYSIGVLLHEALAGERPIACDRGWLDSAERIRCEAPTPLRRVRRPRVPVDRDLETIVLKAIAKSPARRYESVASLRADLERWERGEAVEARRDSRWYVAGKFLSKHRRGAIVASAALLALMAFSAGASVLYRRARSETEKLARVNIFLEDTLGSVEPDASDRAITLRRTLDEGAVWIDLAFRGDRPSEAAIRHILGVGYRNLGAMEEAEVHLSRALELQCSISGADSEPAARALTALALLRSDQGRYAEGMRLLREAESIRDRVHGADSTALEGTRACMALLLAASGAPDDAGRRLEAILAQRRRRLGGHHPDVAMTEYQLANIRAQAGDLAEALRLHEASLATRQAALDPVHPDLARSRLAVAERLVERREFDRARSLLRASLESFGERFGSDSPLAKRTAQLLGDCTE